MAYDLHIVRTADRLDAPTNPITKDEVDHLITADPTLAWSDQGFVEMKSGAGETTRYYIIEWNGVSCFYWYRDQIVCSGVDQVQIGKLLRIATTLNASLMGTMASDTSFARLSLAKRKS